MEADAYVAKGLGRKLKKELVGLGEVLGVPLRKSWTRRRMAEVIGRCCEDNPVILLHALSFSGAKSLRKALRTLGHRHPVKGPIFRELEFLGLAWKMPKPGRIRGASPEGGKAGDEGSGPVEESIPPCSPLARFLLERRHMGLLRRLDAMERLLRGMVRAFGLLEEETLVRMAVLRCLEGLGNPGQDDASFSLSVEAELRSLLRRRLSLLSDVQRFQEGGRTYLHHPFVKEPDRLLYRIESGPALPFKAFTFEELVRLGEGMDAQCPSFLHLSGFLEAFRFRKEAEAYPYAHGRDGSDARREAERNSGRRKGSARGKEGRERELLNLCFRIRQGAPNLEVVRDIMECLSFEDHMEVERFLERFISCCDALPRWDLKGHRMNEVG